MEKPILSVGELDFIEGEPFKYVLSKNQRINYDKSNRCTLRYEKELPSTWITSAKKARWILKGDYEYDLNKVNLLNTNPFDEKKDNLYFFEGHETARTRKIKEDREREAAEKARQETEEKARIAAENARLAEEKRKQLEEERKRAWDADAPNRAIREAQEQEAAKVKKAEETRLREEAEELLRQRINAGTPATIDNVFIGDRVKHNGREATVIDQQYQIKYTNGTDAFVKCDQLINMTAVERTIKQEAKNNEKGVWRSGGTRKRKRKNRKTRYGLETRS